MRKAKRNIIIATIFLVIYFLVNYIYINLISNNKKVCVLNKDVLEGQIVTKEDITIFKLNIPRNTNISNYIEGNFKDEFIAANDIPKGKILMDLDLIKKDEYIYEDQKEIIEIELDKEDFVLNSKIKRKNIINLYFKFNKNEESKNVELIQQNLKVIDVIKKEDDIYKIIVCLKNDKVNKIKEIKGQGVFSISLLR